MSKGGGRGSRKENRMGKCLTSSLSCLFRGLGRPSSEGCLP